MSETKQGVIGILGGTFDPIHFGHLRIAIEILAQLPLLELRLLPCGIPPHRPAPPRSAAQRLQMLEYALEDAPENLIVDDREIRRPGKSYMVDTLQSLKDDYPQQHLALIMGADAFVFFHTWHRYQDILQLAHIIVATRPNTLLLEKNNKQIAPEIIDLLHKQKILPQDLLEKSAGGILPWSVTLLDISSSKIRNLLENQQLAHYLLPSKVLDYIQKHKLYI